MTIVGLLMLLVFGFMAVRHVINGRYFWAILSGFGSLLGAGSLWVEYQRATSGVSDAEAPPPSASESAPVIGDYRPPTEAARPDRE